jgi:hydroxylamine dehydrogenase
MRQYNWFIFSGVLIAGLMMAGAISPAMAQPNYAKVKEYRIERSMPPEAVACIECHKQTNPGLFGDWANSRHANANITCLDCHLAQPGDTDVAKGHDKYYSRGDLPYGEQKYKVPIAAIVTPKDCSRCHPDEVTQYSKSKHANTIEIMWKLDPWLNKGMNSDNERKTGCLHCHGTVVAIDDKGKLDSTTWPNVGVGRLNLDGSKGSCTSCHTRHRFAVSEARKPEACDSCHLGPDHPQIEIYEESKHGTIYNAFKDEFNFKAAAGTWTPGTDYRAPTCAACHMSGSGKVMGTHDVTERISWETQAPLTVRPAGLQTLPLGYGLAGGTGKDEKCLPRLPRRLLDQRLLRGFRQGGEEYNEVYFKPAKAKLDELYGKGLLDKTKFFDERLEVEYYELWHHEGRRARMGTMMMAPDYAWWHGFYECKLRFANFMEEANHLIETNQKAYIAKDFPNATGDTTRPPKIFVNQ